MQIDHTKPKSMILHLRWNNQFLGILATGVDFHVWDWNGLLRSQIAWRARGNMIILQAQSFGDSTVAKEYTGSRPPPPIKIMATMGVAKKGKGMGERERSGEQTLSIIIPLNSVLINSYFIYQILPPPPPFQSQCPLIGWTRTNHYLVDQFSILGFVF